MPAAALVALDLDDTLYDEAEFLHSAYRAIAEQLATAGLVPDRDEAYQQMVSGGFDPMVTATRGRATIPWLVDRYRNHRPESLSFRPGARQTLRWLATCPEVALALVTDGRSGTQRAKIDALGLGTYIQSSDILVSQETGADKRTPAPWLSLAVRHPFCQRFLYIGDSVAKDFIWPPRLGWDSLCVLSPQGRNIHRQDATMARLATSLPPVADWEQAREAIRGWLDS